MAKLKLLHSRSTLDSDVVEFDVEFFADPMREGETFRTYEAGHVVEWTVLRVSQTDPVVLTCKGEYGVGFDDQFTPALVDTEAKDRSEAFKYIKE